MWERVPYSMLFNPWFLIGKKIFHLQLLFEHTFVTTVDGTLRRHLTKKWNLANRAIVVEQCPNSLYNALQNVLGLSENAWFLGKCWCETFAREICISFYVRIISHHGPPNCPPQKWMLENSFWHGCASTKTHASLPITDPWDDCVYKYIYIYNITC